MRSLRWAMVLLAWASAAAAVEVRSYDVRLVTSVDGQASGTAAIAVEGSSGGMLTLPLAFAAPTVRLVAAPPGTRLSQEHFNDQTRLRFEMPPMPPQDARLELAFHVADAFTQPVPAAGQKNVLPEGSRLFEHALVNTEPVTIRRYRCTVIFPEGLRAHAIREALPKAGLKESEPRVQLKAIGGEAGAQLQIGALHQGDTASMRLELVQKARSPFWLVAGLLLSILYLVYFRDLVAGPAGTTARMGEAPGSGE